MPAGTLTIADGEAATIAGVSELFAAPERARAMGLAAAAWVRREWRWERIYQRLDDLLAELGVKFAG